MNLKKILPLFIALSCVLCGCKTSDPMEKFYKYYHVSTEPGELIGITIVSCSLDTEEIQIPSEISGKKVIGLDGGMIEDGPYLGAFEACSGNIKRIVIPKGGCGLHFNRKHKLARKPFKNR